MTNRAVPVSAQANREAQTRALVQAYIRGMNYVAGLPNQTVVILGLEQEPTRRFVFSPGRAMPTDVEIPLNTVGGLREARVIDNVLRLMYDPLFGFEACVLRILGSVSALLGFTDNVAVMCAGAYYRTDGQCLDYVAQQDSALRRRDSLVRSVPCFTYQR